MVDQPLEQMEIIALRHDSEGDPSERWDLALRMADLWRTRLDDPLRAVDAYKELLQARPDAESVVAALTSMVADNQEARSAADVLLTLHGEAGAWDRAVDVKEALIEHEADPSVRVPMLREMAEIRERELNDLAGAFAAVGKALVHADSPQVGQELLEELERLAEAGDQWDRFVELLDGEAERHSDDPHLASTLILRTADACERALENPAGAMDRYARALEVDPSRLEILESLDRLHQREGRWAGLAEVLERRVSSTEDVEARVELLMRLGSLQETALEREDLAVAVYRRVLDEIADHAAAVKALERLLGSPAVDPSEVYPILDPLYRQGGEWEKWVGLQERALEGGAGEPEARRAQMCEVASVVMAELGDSTRALGWYGRAYQESSDDEGLVEQLESLAGEHDDWDALGGVYLDAHGFADTPDGQAAVLLRVARIYEEIKDEAEQAETCYLQVLASDEGRLEALVALDRLYTAGQRWADAAAIIERRLAQEEEGDSPDVSLLFRLARLQDEELGDLDAAVDSYRRVLGADPAHEGALRALETAYLGREEWEALFGVYEGLAAIAEGDSDRAEVHARMADLAAEHLQRPSDAIFIWTGVLEMVGEEPRALTALAGLYEAEARWEDSADALERLSHVLDDPEREADVLSQLGLILQTHLARREEALGCWQRVSAIRPDDVPALIHL